MRSITASTTLSRRLPTTRWASQPSRYRKVSVTSTASMNRSQSVVSRKPKNGIDLAARVSRASTQGALSWPSCFSTNSKTTKVSHSGKTVRMPVRMYRWRWAGRMATV